MLEGIPILRTILSHKEVEILKDEKAQLERLQLLLASFDVTPEDQKTLQRSIHQLDELFLLVVVQLNPASRPYQRPLGERFLR
jgi:hypothetical protein